MQEIEIVLHTNDRDISYKIQGNVDEVSAGLQIIGEVISIEEDGRIIGINMMNVVSYEIIYAPYEE